MVNEMKNTRRLFVLIDTDPDKDAKVEEQLMKFDEIFELHYLSGQYDILAIANVEIYGNPIFSEVQDVSYRLIEKIRKITGVRDTSSWVPFRSLVKTKEKNE